MKLFLIIGLLFSTTVFATVEDFYLERMGPMTLMVVGEGEAFERKVPNLKGKATCFKLDVIDMANNAKIGTAIDCLSEIEVDEETGNMNLIGTTIFKLPMGKLFTQGPLAARAIDIPIGSASGLEATHITGAGSEGNTIIKGTKAYKHASGNVRLSGMVDLSDLDVGLMRFSCIFHITDLDLGL